MASSAKNADCDHLSKLIDSATLESKLEHRNSNGDELREHSSSVRSSRSMNGRSPRLANAASESSGLNANKSQQPSWRSPVKAISSSGK